MPEPDHPLGRLTSANPTPTTEGVRGRGLKVFGILGRGTGHTAKHGDIAIVVPAVDPALITPHSEAFQAVVWHCLVSHPALQIKKTKW